MGRKLISVNGQKILWEYQSWSKPKKKAMGLSIHWEKGFNVTILKLFGWLKSNQDVIKGIYPFFGEIFNHLQT